MNRGGRAARFAFDPAVVVAFLDVHTTVKTDGVPRRKRRYINGLEVRKDNEARVIRRWRNHAEGATLQGVARLLLTFDLTVPQLVTWAESHGMKPVLRGSLTLPATRN